MPCPPPDEQAAIVRFLDHANGKIERAMRAKRKLIALVNARPEVLVLHLRATGKYFCSGYDIGSIGGGRKVEFASIVDALEEARPVTIAVLTPMWSMGSLSFAAAGQPLIAVACLVFLGLVLNDTRTSGKLLVEQFGPRFRRVAAGR